MKPFVYLWGTGLILAVISYFGEKYITEPQFEWGYNVFKNMVTFVFMLMCYNQGKAHTNSAWWGIAVAGCVVCGICSVFMPGETVSAFVGCMFSFCLGWLLKDIKPMT